MKIYPGGHIISTSEQITTNHIPIAYFKKSNDSISPSIIIEDEFCRRGTVENIYPYQQFSNNKILFFDENENSIENSSDYLIRRNDIYYYEPKDSVEFIPTNVNMSILLNRVDTFKNNVKYDVTIGCYNEEIAEALIGLFNVKSQLKPNNININNGAMNPFDLIDIKNKTPDFMFINESDVSEEVLNKYIDDHINVWLLIDNIDDAFCLANENMNDTYVIGESFVYNDVNHVLKSYNKLYFNAVNTPDMLKGYEMINMFSSYMPVVIYKKENCGFVIVSHSNIIKDVEESYRLIFEILMNVYLNSYFKTNNKSFIITDEKIDYFISLNRKFNEYHPRINLDEILFECGQNSYIASSIVSFDFGEEEINFIGSNKQRNLFFRKATKSDPDKKAGSISIYTTNKTILNYDFDKNVIKLIENKLVINYKRIEDKNYIVIDSFKSSLNSICLDSSQTIHVPNDSRYVLYYDRFEEKFNIVNENVYDVETYGKKFATIKLDYGKEINCFDMRIVGGGEDPKVVNYEMIDTGSIKGRPYRVGSTMIIKLPKRFEKHKDKIISEVKKHMSSADYPILLFE